MIKLINCDVKNCHFYARNGPDRENEDEYIDNNEDNNNNDMDLKTTIYQDILDNIYTHFV